MEDLEERARNHRFHMEKLELLIRLLDNNAISPAQIEEIKEEVDLYLDNYQDEDFYVDLDMYEVLDLENAGAVSGNRKTGSPRSADRAALRSVFAFVCVCCGSCGQASARIVAEVVHTEETKTSSKKSSKKSTPPPRFGVHVATACLTGCHARVVPQPRRRRRARAPLVVA